jgi:hypothetical protein
MTTLAEMALKVAREVTDVMDGVAMTGSATTLTDSVNLIQAAQFWKVGTLFIKNGTHAGKVIYVKEFSSNRLTFDSLSSVLCVQQVETATVLGTVTGNGNATVIVTAAGMTGSPKTVSVAVLNLDSASAVGGKIRTALGTDTDISNFFTIGGSGANIILTAKVAVANDTTMNISIDNGTCTGLTAAPTSANTTAGVAGPRYAVMRGVYPWQQIVTAINQALESTYIDGFDQTLIGDGETVEFTMPTGVYDIKRVESLRDSELVSVSNHWREVNGKLRFDYGYAPVDADVINIVYKDQHAVLDTYEDTISSEINVEWLKYKAAEQLLWWGVNVYGNIPEYRIEEKMNKVLAMLKGKQPRRDGPDIILHTGG